jgi:GTP-binding protein LepA
MFDSYYDAYRGVISSVRVFNGALRSGAKLRYLNARQMHEAEEIGVRLPVPTPVAMLGPGEVGYLIAGIKDVGEAKVGETVTDAGHQGEPSRVTAIRSPWCSAVSIRSTATSTPTCGRRWSAYG